MGNNTAKAASTVVRRFPSAASAAQTAVKADVGKAATVKAAANADVRRSMEATEEEKEVLASLNGKDENFVSMLYKVTDELEAEADVPSMRLTIPAEAMPKERGKSIAADEGAA